MLNSWKEIHDEILGYYPEADTTFLSRLFALLNQLEDPSNPATVELVGDALLVGKILVRLRMDLTSIAAGMLLEAHLANRLSKEQVEREMGPRVVPLMEGISRLIHVADHRGDQEVQAVEFRKMLLAMARDIRVVLVRLAICAMQLRRAVVTCQQVDQRFATDVFDVYAPIAHRLGIHWLKSEMEDLAFRWVHPQEYEQLRQGVDKARRPAGGENDVHNVINDLKKKLRAYGIQGKVTGREKHLYSVWSKIQNKAGSLDELFDLIGYRIIVTKKKDCYQVLGMIHSEMTPIPGRFKDYIAMPKSNGYQSLHTGVVGPGGNRIEIQIRTEKMHQVAESGVAAHWSYKDGEIDTSHSPHATGYAWLRKLLELYQTSENPEQFLEGIKFDLFPEEIYVFTPVGRIVTLPSGATPVDFAYAVHSEVGDTCQGAKVNSRIVPLRTRLKIGDTVEILTSKGHHPNPDWLEFVVTSKARYRISRFVKTRQREGSISQGREILEREIRKLAAGYALTEKSLAKAAEASNLPNGEEVLAKIGRSVLSPVVVIHRMFPELMPRKENETPSWEKLPDRKPGNESPELKLSGILSDMEVHAARCCTPVPGDAVVGIISTGRGITLHVRGCPNLTPLMEQKERWLEAVEWAPNRVLNHGVRLRVVAANHKDVFSLVSHAVTEAKASLLEMRILDRGRDPCSLLMEVEVSGLDHLHRVMQRVRSVSAVLDVIRAKG
ncbi:MAG: bifunctional (p)ppGpp synthetase/guanosine-3',5'-bis(diphosphate) 3'-pyrophosphohydrolase [Magnetococcales bacterium]|nr:bifunctional (p)ppGpp synthetase/guanosine-3',5'-bis(diphosphate) 3'-pyrophosphohydrolase [Magnetococcales bacterium]